MMEPGQVETIDQMIELARHRLEPGRWAWAESGAGQEVTLARNSLALNQLALVPHVGRDVGAVNMSTSLGGVVLDLPVVLAPVGALAVYDPGDALAAAQAATNVGTSVFCSIYCTIPWEQVAATAPGRHFFQLYVMGDRLWQGDILARVEEAGFGGVCITMDSAMVGRRDRSLRSDFRWSSPAGGTVNFGGALPNDPHRRSFTWRDLEWISGQTSLPVVVKGVMTGEDAMAAVDSGARVVYVSNHGGRMVDHEVSSIEMLTEVVEAVPAGIDVAIDSGFTRGVEVCKAIALGARAVGIGRLQCWGLAAGGPGMLTRVLQILHEEIEVTMANVGCPSLGSLSPEQVRWSLPAPPGADR